MILATSSLLKDQRDIWCVVVGAAPLAQPKIRVKPALSDWMDFPGSPYRCETRSTHQGGGSKL